MRELRAPRYLRHFRCLAERCEDTCCAGMRVPASAADVARLTSALPHSSLPSLVEDGALRSDAAGRCVVLDHSGLCSAQRAGGEAALPEACARFPRVFTDVGGDLELSASLACPEVVRLLLAEGAFDVDHLPWPAGAPAGAKPQLEDTRPREALARVWRGAESARIRRAALAQFAWRFDQEPADGVRLDALAGVPREAFVSEATQVLGGLVVSSAGPRTFALALLRGARANVRTPRFERFAQGVLQSYESWASPSPPDDDAAVGVEREVEKVLGSYLEHELWRRPWARGSGLQRLVLGLVVEMGVLRCWLSAPRRTGVPAVDTVEAIQLFAKHLARSELLAATLDGWAAEGPDATLARSLSFG